MKVLVVDDNNDKVISIKNVLLKEAIAEEDIHTVVSVNDAVLKLYKEQYQLMIVDMCLPECFGNPLSENGGLKLLQIVDTDTRLKPPAMVLILTAHEGLIEQYKEELSKCSFEVVRYMDNSEEWKSGIVEKLRYQKRREKTPAEGRQYQYDLAILTAVTVEAEAVKRLASKWEKVRLENDSTVYWSTEWEVAGKKCKVIRTTLPQMGMVAAATMTSKLIYNFAPRYLFMPGIAAGVKEEYEFGDIIVPKEVKDYCSGKYTTPVEGDKDALKNPLKYFVPSAASISTDADIINMMADSYHDELRQIHSEWPGNDKYKVPSIRTGYMASGDSVIQNAAIVESMIKSHLRHADGIDMEAYGMFYAASQAIKPQPVTVCMKAISDFANKEKSDDHQAYAAYVSANFMKCFVMKELM